MTGTMDDIGRVKLVQVQRSGLKVSDGSSRIYNPAPLCVVDRLILTAEGVIGLLTSGENILDVHHVTHLQSRNADVNSVSIGFTRHYVEMRDRFGDHLSDGIAGENIIVEAEKHFNLPDLGHRLAIQNHTTGTLYYLTNIMVAEPCVEFSHFALNQPDPPSPVQVKAALQYLGNGRRGFYASLAPEHDRASVGAGDKVFVIH